MHAGSFHIRPSEPTHKNGLHFAHHLNHAFRGQIWLLLSPRATKTLAEAFTRPGHDLSYEHTLIAEHQGTIVGMASGYTADQHRRASDGPLKEAAGLSIVWIAVMSLLAWPLLRFLQTCEDGDFYVQFLAVDDAHRRKGIGSRLLRALEDKAIESASTRLALDVESHNAGARRLYERHGFAVSDQWPRSRLFRPTLLRMVKPLGPTTQTKTRIDTGPVDRPAGRPSTLASPAGRPDAETE